MKGSHVLSTLIAAGLVAAMISYFLNPKLEQREAEAAAPTLATVSVEAAEEPETSARRTASIRLGTDGVIDSIKIGQVHIRNVDAMVLRTDLEQSLLGMSFLRELYSYEFRGNRLLIRQ